METAQLDIMPTHFYFPYLYVYLPINSFSSTCDFLILTILGYEAILALEPANCDHHTMDYNVELFR